MNCSLINHNNPVLRALPFIQTTAEVILHNYSKFPVSKRGLWKRPIVWQFPLFSEASSSLINMDITFTHCFNIYIFSSYTVFRSSWITQGVHYCKCYQYNKYTAIIQHYHEWTTLEYHGLYIPANANLTRLPRIVNVFKCLSFSGWLCLHCVMIELLNAFIHTEHFIAHLCV